MWTSGAAGRCSITLHAEFELIPILLSSKGNKMKKNLYFTKEHELVRSAVKNFVNKEIQPNIDEWEEQGHAPLHDLFKKMGDPVRYQIWRPETGLLV